MKFWARTTLFTAGADIHAEGLEHIESQARASTGMFLVGNHQSDLDVPILIAALPYPVRFMAKDSLFNIPLFGWIIKGCGYIPVYRHSARKTLASLRAILEEDTGYPIATVVFPEGTRSSDGVLLPFRRGALRIGRLTGLPIVPFSIEGSIRVHRRGVFKARPGKVKLTFHKPLGPDEIAELSADELHDRVYRDIVSALPEACLPGTADNDAPPMTASAVAAAGGI
jgi:1-acyl-sn-glycerol-3-phosphate acyltransferase